MNYEKIKQAVLEAGKLMNSEYTNEKNIISKGKFNFVTSIDIEVQEFLIKELNKIIPGCNIISEETSKNLYNLEGATFILDPIDGTTNFMYNMRHSAISLALFTDKRPEYAIIYNPSTNEIFEAEYNMGAYLNGTRINVNKSASLNESLIGFGTTPYDRKNMDKTFSILKELFKECIDIRRSGSAALDIAYVACGRLDAFFEMTLQPWDFAAGLIILNEAGGKITDWNGMALKITEPSSILATNKFIHEELLKHLKL